MLSRSIDKSFCFGRSTICLNQVTTVLTGCSTCQIVRVESPIGKSKGEEEEATCIVDDVDFKPYSPASRFYNDVDPVSYSS